MLIVRSLRQDRVAFCVTSFIVSNLGSRFIEPPVLNMKLVSGSAPCPHTSGLPPAPCCSFLNLFLSHLGSVAFYLRPSLCFQVMEDSSPRSPLVFILSPGVDPTSALLQLAENTGMAQRFHALSLGQGQAPIAARLLRDGVMQG
jgi:dynein heavy chain